MAERTFYVVCKDDCLTEGMSKEQILTAIEQSLEQGYVSDPGSAVFSKIKEIRANGTAQIWIGTEAQFNAISPAPTIGKSVVRIDENGVMYICSDDSTMNDIFQHIDDENNPHNVTFRQVAGTDVLPTSKGGTGNTNGRAVSAASADAATKLATARTIRTNLASTSTASFDGSANVSPGVTGVLPTANGGTGNTNGRAVSAASADAATKLATARTIRTNLASTSTASFDGSANVSPGVTGTLPIANGGHGSTTADGACANLGAVKKSGDTMTGSLYSNGFVQAGQGQTYAARIQGSSNEATFSVRDSENNAVNYFSLGSTGATLGSGLKANGTVQSTSFTVEGNSAYPTIGFHNADGSSSGVIQSNSNTRTMLLRNFATDTEFYESFYTPAPNTGLTENKIYTLYSTKNIIYSSSEPPYVAGAIWLKPVD